MRMFVLLFMLASSGPLLAATSDAYPLASEADQERFRNLTKELRCPKCQNQNISDSNAPIAQDMKDEVYRMVQAGATDDEVVAALVSRFGEFVRYKPQVERRTLLLWATPVLVVLGGMMIVAGVVIRSRRNPENASGLTDEQRQRAERMLNNADAGDAEPPDSQHRG